ncbi:MAG: response regulator [Gammaproteobacteria bacterium]
MIYTPTAGLQDLILDAMDEISILLGTPSEELESSSIADICNLHLDNLSMAATIAERPGLQLLCDNFQQHIASLATSDLQTTELLQWLSILSSYLEKPDDPQVCSSLLSSFDEGQRELLTDMLQQDLKNSQQSDTPLSAISTIDDWQTEISASDIDDDDDNDDFDSSMMRTTDILNMFLEEFIDVSERMDKLLSGLTPENFSDAQSQQALLHYQELIDRVLVTSNSLSLSGLGQVCKFVKYNVAMFDELIRLAKADFEAIKTLLSGWHSPVINYIRTPNDDDACIQLVNYLQHETWPEPLLDTQAQELLVLLTQGLEDFDTEDAASHRVHTASAEDISLEIANDASDTLIDAFFHEAPTLAVEFTEHIEKLVKGENVQKNTESAQRLAHTLKGSANLIGAKGVANLTHHIEDILEYLSHKQTTPPAQLAEALRESADTVETMIEAMQGVCERPDDAQRVLQSILDWANRIDQGNLDDVVEATAISSIQAPANNLADQIKAPPASKQTVPQDVTSASRGEVLHIPISQVDEMFRLVGEMSIAIGQTKERIKGLIDEGETLNNLDIIVQQRRFELENLVDVKNIATRQRRLRVIGGNQARFDPLEMDEFNDMHSAVHSYIESVADLRSISQQLRLESHNLDSLLAQQNQLYNELQEIVMRTRMVAVDTIVARLQRSVRQACRATGKNSRLEINGTELHIDGDVLSKLTAPLMHMLRNAIDHGIETTAERQDLGKPEEGLVSLSFTQIGNQVVVQCTDDGRGLDYKRIRKMAEDRGLISSGQPLNDTEVARLILQPGFTTRDSATQISGRGVGMDVVNSTVTGLKGVLEIADSDSSSGCQFTLRLPITLVTNHSILASVENELFAIPTSSLVQILTPGIGTFGSLGSDLTYQLNKDIYPTKQLSKLLNINSQMTSDEDTRKYTLLVRSDSGIVAVVVDNVVNSYDLVVKNMGRYVKSVKGVTGISVLGNGNVIPVLDLPDLLRHQAQNSVTNQANDVAKFTETRNIPQVLIVDDSLSVRQSLSQLVEDTGFEAVLARDGIEAMDMIRKQVPNIVLADMEMPRMNGLELTSAIRNNSQTNALPVIMITSRSMQKHRVEAEKAGVNIYMTKPFAEDILLSNIQALMDTPA